VTQNDPFITKTVNPPFSLPGEPVTWTITVFNPGNAPATNITVTDPLPAEVEIISVNATSGTVSHSGQTVNFTLPVLAGGQQATITINSRVRSTVAVPFILTNVATLTNAENTTPRTGEATVLSVGHLPKTGETPWWRMPVLVLVSAIGAWGLLRLSIRLYHLFFRAMPT
jgi:uncharacterized repeat protein (TIGR01451 family)